MTPDARGRDAWGDVCAPHDIIIRVHVSRAFERAGNEGSYRTLFDTHPHISSEVPKSVARHLEYDGIGDD